MEMIKLKAEIVETNVYKVIFSDKKSVSINILEDVDLTELIKELTSLIGEDVELELEKYDTEDPKTILIQNTIEKIVKSFNQSNSEQEEDDDMEDDIPF